MLLSEKLSNRVVRQNQDETSATLALPIALLHHVAPTIQANVLLQIIEEVRRLVICATDPVNKAAAFLDHIVLVHFLFPKKLWLTEIKGRRGHCSCRHLCETGPHTCHIGWSSYQTGNFGRFGQIRTRIAQFSCFLSYQSCNHGGRCSCPQT